MSEDLDIMTGGSSDKVKLTGMPYLMLRLNGSSYVNKKAASLLGLEHGDTLSFYYRSDLSEWWITNHPTTGALIQKSGGLYKFCDYPNIRKFFKALQDQGKLTGSFTKAFFPLAHSVQIIKDTDCLFIIPKPVNIE